jgi:hypothetical protein
MIQSAKKLQNRPIEINLLGEQGNAYYLLAVASQLAKQLDLDFDVVRKEMTESDYENLIKVFDAYFGAYVILYR